jgi:hypothetical protein
MQNESPEEKWKNVVREQFPSFKEIYSSEDEMLNYGLKFQQIYKEYMKAFDEFFGISEFFRVIQLLIKTKNEGEKDSLTYNYEKREDALSLIMMISLIEKLCSKKDFVPFHEWIKEKGLKCEKIRKIWEEYNKDFGCSHKFRNFFAEQKYLEIEEQLKLLRSVYYFVKNENNKETSVPMFCYDKAICGKSTHCRAFDKYAFDNKFCPASSDEKLRKTALKEFANFLYELRNRFVHNAHMFRLSEESARLGKSSVYDYISYEFHYIKKPPYAGAVRLKLSPVDIKRILEKNFKKLLDNYIKARTKTS